MSSRFSLLLLFVIVYAKGGVDSLVVDSDTEVQPLVICNAKLFEYMPLKLFFNYGRVIIKSEKVVWNPSPASVLEMHQRRFKCRILKYKEVLFYFWMLQLWKASTKISKRSESYTCFCLIRFSPAMVLIPWRRMGTMLGLNVWALNLILDWICLVNSFWSLENNWLKQIWINALLKGVSDSKMETLQHR